MKIIKPFTLGVLHRPYPFLGENRLAIAAIGFFRLGQDCERLLPDAAQWPLVLPLLAPGMALDEVMPKRRGEALLLGSAHAPGAAPLACMCVRMQVGPIDKVLRVVGERSWGYSLRRGYQVGAARPFTRMALDWSHAYGGAGHPANPGGRGYAGLRGVLTGAMPNLEYAGTPVRSHWRRLAPAGYGPIAPDCAPRHGKAGSYGARWLASEAPGFASDIDWSVFNRAPRDQWLPAYFSGGEAYRLEGMHPDRPLIEGSLPRLAARAFMLAPGAPADEAREVALALDTVWFLPEQELGILVYHGETVIGDSDGLDVGAVMVAYEQAGAPKSLAHYRQVLALRGDPLQAAQHLFNEAQLAPALSVASTARNAQVDGAERAAALARNQRQLDELDREHWQQAGQAAPAGHQSARAEPPPFSAPGARALASGDFDLAPVVAGAKALADAARERAAGQATPAAAAPDPAAQWAAALARAIVPAYDLLPAGETGCDPVIAGQLAQLDQLRSQGRLADASWQQARGAVLAAPAQRRAARRAASVAAAAPLLCATAATLLGEQVRAWRASGVSLAGRDLAGADLRGIDLAGADLRETLFDGADLSGARLGGANLQGAVLLGAALARADLDGANLDGANLCASAAAGASLRGASLRKAHAGAADWRAADLTGAVLDQLVALRIDLRGAILDQVHAHSAMLMQAQADDSSWRGADLDTVTAPRASLQRADFSAARLRACTLIDADLRASVWDGASINALQGAGATDWRGASLRGVRATQCGMHSARLAGADLRGASFVRCDFSAASLAGARLDQARFAESVFMGADLAGASARGADFFRAICRKADLRGADLAGAHLFQTELSGALLAATVPGSAA